MTYSLDDTIAAIATAPGEAGIGIVRLSGRETLPLLQQMFRPAAPAWEARSHQMSYGFLVDEAGERLDEVMVVWFQAPRSYTCEDVVEIHAHGGSVAVRQALALSLRAGARLAEPGEMTLRAFLNGRLDLAQAEAVLDVVRARTERGMQAAMEQLGGTLSQEIREARAALLAVLAHLTATIDFPEDDVPPQNILPDLLPVQALLECLLQNADRGILLREGLRVAIVGLPNVGKSSLLNRLLRHERAIVTEIPGTTRDVLEESLNLRGIPIVLADTAGIRQTQDRVEALGVERSHATLEQANLVLFVLDSSEPLRPEDHTLAAALAGRPVIVVENKQDVAVEEPGEPLPLLPEAPHVPISAMTGLGIDELEEQMWQMVMGGGATGGDTALITNPRHKQAIQQAIQHIAAAIEGAQQGLPADFLTIDLHAAVNALGEITGENATEDLLDAIFSRFCIGK
ncbi:MAG: tRNA uridine-5-carboxymethylaminomethyl(34) synthesis GTPase MnmE [Ardenticatenales bacterium]|nr:tRNA uridine-5-carboxymethylaminomethyl(34) synthesis GTPase MnmE [Ardenticatenales bacterium]